MVKRFLMLSALGAISILMGSPSRVVADVPGQCIYQCGSSEIQLQPGQPLTVQIINRTQGRINLERILDFNAYAMRPNQVVQLNTLVGSADLSIVFWEDNYGSVDARLHRPEPNLLQIELLPGASGGDLAVHIVNDGRVLIY